jgi:signal peptidase I
MKVLSLAVVLVTMLQTPAIYQRGDVVRVKGEGNIPSVRVIAVPGDRVRINDSGVYVNDAPVTWVSSDLLAALPKPWQPEVMAEGQYFVAGLSRTESNGTLSKSAYWAYTGADSLERIAR